MFKDLAVPAARAKNMLPEELEGKLVTGVLQDIQKTEFCEEYQKVVDSQRKGK
jgi:2-oxoglutarate ferredoxin oxidoreductase subunit beta